MESTDVWKEANPLTHPPNLNMAHHGTLSRVARANSRASTLIRQWPDIKALADLEISVGISPLGDVVFLVHLFSLLLK